MNFRKLISNVPFNPSLVSQVAFYGRRVKQESSLRRLGFVMIALAMFIQMIAVIAPPERSLAASPSHILDGVSSSNDILAAWDRPGSDIPAIYGKFGLTRDDIVNLPTSPNATVRSNAGPDYWTTGRQSLASFSNVNSTYKNTEIALQAGPTTVYMRQLRAWDIVNPYNTYSAWRGTKKDGTVFWILKDCGNYTQVGKFTPKNPQLEIRKSTVGQATVQPGGTFTYRIEYRNTVPDSLAENVKIQDVLDLSHFDIVSPSGLAITNGLLMQPVGNLAYSANYHVLDITVRVKNPLPDAKRQLCNAAGIFANNFLPLLISNAACINVNTPCVYNPAIPSTDINCKPKTPPPAPCKLDPTIPASDANCKQPELFCALLDTDLDKVTRTASFKTTVSTTNERATKIVSYAYDFGDGKKVTLPSTALTNTTSHTYAAGSFTSKVVVSYTVTGTTKTTQSVTCSDKITFEGDKPLGESKTVKNITQKLSGDKANGTTVQAGDVLEYTLLTTNSQDYARKNVAISDYVGDILDYGDLDMAFLEKQGGSYDGTTKKVKWSNITLAANTDISKSFRVTIKSPVPSTNSPSGASGTFDCRISNKYGNSTEMLVQCPVVKGIESLPNTGPGTSAAFGFIVTAGVGYFFARSRLLARELELIKEEYAPTGGF